MNVLQIRETLRNLASLFQAGGAAKQSQELQNLERAIAADLADSDTVATLIGRLKKGGNLRNGATKPPPPPQVDAVAVAARIKAVDDRAADPSRTPQEVAEALMPLAQLKVAGLQIVAAQLGLPLPKKCTKGQIIIKIEQRVRERAGAVHRTVAAG
jgi:hypothetical protein